MFRLLTFGGLAVEPGDGSAGDLRLRPKALALLAMLAAAGERGSSRERLIGLFWPDADEEHGRHSLRQLLYAIKGEAGLDLVRSESSLFLDARHLESDLAEFHVATKSRDWGRVAALYRGSFLEGFYLSGASEFERWVEQERARLATIAESALQALATDSTARGDHETAAEGWRRLTRLDPLSGRFAMGYVRALTAGGDRSKALAFMREHENVVRRELEAEPDPDIRRLEAELREPTVTLIPSDARGRGRNHDRNEPLAVSAAPSDTVAAPSVHLAGSQPPRQRRLWISRVLVAMAGVAIIAALGMVLARRGANVSTRSAVAARLYDEGLRSYYAGDMSGTLRLMSEALREDTSFAMAAYYVAVVTQGDEAEHAARQRARRLALAAPEPERLMITAELLFRDHDPGALAIAREWASRYPRDARAFSTLSHALSAAGEWAAAVAAIERAIALHREADGFEQGEAPREICPVCDYFGHLGALYMWWDSLPAVERTARRSLDAKPGQAYPWMLLSNAAARAGDTAEAIRRLNRLQSATAQPIGREHELLLHLTLEHYDLVEQETRAMLRSSRADEAGVARWLLPIALRNQGRLAEAEQLLRTGRMSGGPPPLVPQVAVDYVNEGLIALESGNPARAASYWEMRGRLELPRARGQYARWVAWHTTLSATALAAAGDTVAVRRLADTVQYWGEQSAFGRDRRLHHFLRGLLLAKRGEDAAAVEEYRAAIFGWSLGYTRINYELAKALLRLDRPDEAVAALAPALRGGPDAANLYVTRTELHELLAEAHRRAGNRDSAAVHDRAVVRAWARADPQFVARREAARARLAAVGR